MSQNLMAQLVRYENSCCIYGFFAKHQQKTNRELADYLGVTPHTVRVWRRRISEGDVGCGYGATGLEGCVFKNI